jgi:hypothetical protein
MTSKKDSHSELDQIVASADLAPSPWDRGNFKPDLDVARRLFSVPVLSGEVDNQQTGAAARSLDVWIAHELRRAGLPPGSVWPRAVSPRVLPAEFDPVDTAVQEARRALEKLALRIRAYEGAAKKKGLKKDAPSLRDMEATLNKIERAFPGKADARILGSFYVKQVDVAVSTWQRGPDVLVSGKTQLSSYGKNTNNRYEEAVGDGKNLRDRYPLAAMGFAHVVRSTILDEEDAFTFLRDRLIKLRKPHGFFDATMLLVLEWDDKTRELAPLEDRSEELTASAFFRDLIDALLRYTPVGVHQDVRELRFGDTIGVLPEAFEDVSPDEAAAHDAE